jgi:glycosyltransferase involved in cell wall biosynthesis
MTSVRPRTTDQLRVLFITHAYPRTAGDAAGSFIHRLAKALVLMGVEVRVLAPSAPDLARSETIEGIRVDRFRYAPSSHERLAYTGTMAEAVRGSISGKLALFGMLAAGRRALKAATRDFTPDVVHAHWWFPSALAARAGRRRRPLIITLHGSDIRLAEGVPGAAQLYASVAGGAHTVTAVSSWLAARAATLAPRLPVPQVAPMPVDTDLFAPGQEREEGVALFVGRLNEQKGLHHVIRALPKARALRRLDVAGDGPAETDLRSLAESLGVSDRVNWIGRVTQRELAQLYRSASAIVIPSTNEGLGLVAVEAALAETPAVAFNSGGLTDVVIQDETGILVEPGDSSALGAALERILGNGDEARRMGVEGRRRALERFSPGHVASNYMGIYNAARDAEA